ncbi:MAG: SRPBCC domain-containing protein [Myxococcaceae bacterium]
MSNGFKLSTMVAAKPSAVYRAWLDPRTHAAFTGGGVATSEPRVGGAFTAWEGYIHGTYLVLEPGARIVHAWRTTDFPDGAPDSRVEVLLEPARGGTRLTLVHAHIPSAQEADYRAGWSAFYFRPMKKYFHAAARPRPAKATGARKAKKKSAASRRRAPKRSVSKKSRRAR